MAKGGKRLGFIAQDIAKVLPEIVRYYPDEDKPNKIGWASAYSVDYSAASALLVEAVKELKTANDNQAARLKTLEEEIARMKTAAVKGKEAAP